MSNKAQKIAAIKKLISGEEEGLVYYSLKEYRNEEEPQPNDLYEATTSTGKRIVKRLCNVKGKLRAIVWDEGKTYEVDNLGGRIVVRDKQTATDLRGLSL